MISRTLAELATLCGAVVDGDPSIRVAGAATLSEAGPAEISFLANPRYAPQLATTQAGAVVVTRDFVAPRPGPALLRCDDPNRAFTAIALAFAPAEVVPPAGVHSSAVVDPTAAVDPSASIGPNCTVGREARVGPRARLVANVCVGAHAVIGPDTALQPGVVLYGRVTIGARCVVHGGTVIGSDGFGFEPTRTGWAKIPQVGTVIVGDDVEIGANCTIDRGRFGPTRIGNGVKLDNLVHLAHNVVVEDGALLVAQVGVAGSTRIGKRAILGGQVGVGGHLTIGEGARIGGQTGVMSSIPAGEDCWGTPARPRVETLRSAALVARLPELQKRIREMAKRIEALETASGLGAERPSNQENP